MAVAVAVALNLAREGSRGGSNPNHLSATLTPYPLAIRGQTRAGRGQGRAGGLAVK